MVLVEQNPFFKKMLQACNVCVSPIAESELVILYYLTNFENYISNSVTAKLLMKKY